MYGTSRSPSSPDDAKLAEAGLSTQALTPALQAGGATVRAGSFDEDGSNRTARKREEKRARKAGESSRQAPSDEPEPVSV
ncbi:multidrug efflux pump subunit AcrB [Streptomyces sp. V4I2]|nr:multidrug efflux pump subunit AcrB [Streptomyces sp. V4I2]